MILESLTRALRETFPKLRCKLTGNAIHVAKAGSLPEDTRIFCHIFISEDGILVQSHTRDVRWIPLSDPDFEESVYRTVLEIRDFQTGN